MKVIVKLSLSLREEKPQRMSQSDLSVNRVFSGFWLRTDSKARETGEEATAGIQVSDDGLDPSVATGVRRGQFLTMR